LAERITSDIVSHCHQCGTPCDVQTNCKNTACHILFIQCPNCAAHFHGTCGNECKEFILLPPEIHKQVHPLLTKNHIEQKWRNRIRPRIAEIENAMAQPQ